MEGGHAPSRWFQYFVMAKKRRFRKIGAAQLMHVDGLTRENVASHLQKYRLQLKKENKLDDEGNLISGAGRDSGEPASFLSHDEEPGVRRSHIMQEFPLCWNTCHSRGCAQSPVFSRVLHEGAWKDEPDSEMLDLRYMLLAMGTIL